MEQRSAGSTLVWQRREAESVAERRNCVTFCQAQEVDRQIQDKKKHRVQGEQLVPSRRPRDRHQLHKAIGKNLAELRDGRAALRTVTPGMPRKLI
jgi:hypothetical protein